MKILFFKVFLLMWTISFSPISFAGHWVSGSYTNSAGSRDYKLWVPGGYKAKENNPLIVALHGCGQDAREFAGLTRLNALAEAKGVLVLYPEQNFFSNLSFCWNWFESSNQLRGRGEPSIVVGMLRSVEQKYSVDRARIYVVGASAGGSMTSTLLACYSDVFAAGMVVAGGMYRAATNPIDAALGMITDDQADPNVTGLEAWRCSGSATPRYTPVMVIQGSDDAICSPSNADRVVAQFAKTNDWSDDGLDNNSVRSLATSSQLLAVSGGRTYLRSDYEYGNRLLLVHILVNGMTHRWSGGDSDYSWADPSGPDATKLMWQFFSLHHREFTSAH